MRQGILLRQSYDSNHEKRQPWGLRCCLINKTRGWVFHALYEMDKVTKEQENLKPRKTAFLLFPQCLKGAKTMTSS